MGFEEKLKKEIEGIKIVDMHEHLMPEAKRIKEKADIFWWVKEHMLTNLVSSGMKDEDAKKLSDKNISLDKKWKFFSPFWENLRTTGYGKLLLIAAKDLYGVEDINDKTWKGLSNKITAANKKGIYKNILKKRSGIDISLVDVSETDYSKNKYFSDIDNRFFAPVIRVSQFVNIWNKKDIDEISKSAKKDIFSVYDIAALMETVIEKSKKEGAVAAKFILYRRPLRFEEETSVKAERVFDEIMCEKPNDPKPLQNYLMHHLMKLLLKYKLPLQVHTGLNGLNYISDSNPVLLSNLFIKYPNVMFNVFHAGYPYYQEMGVLAKHFKNVYADMSWVYVISPTASKRILHEWLDVIPNNKIFGFGGDCFITPEMVYSHAKIAREVIWQVLTEKCRRGVITQDDAKDIAVKLLRDNAKKFFKLKI